MTRLAQLAGAEPLQELEVEELELPVLHPGQEVEHLDGVSDPEEVVADVDRSPLTEPDAPQLTLRLEAQGVL